MKFHFWQTEWGERYTPENEFDEESNLVYPCFWKHASPFDFQFGGSESAHVSGLRLVTHAN